MANGCWLGLGQLSQFSFTKLRHSFTGDSLGVIAFCTEQQTFSICSSLKLRDLGLMGGEETRIILSVIILMVNGLPQQLWLHSLKSGSSSHTYNLREIKQSCGM